MKTNKYKPISEYLKIPEKYIPFGLYCIHNDYVCPFWDSKPKEYPKMEDGYCHYLDKSDWDLNEEYEKRTRIVKSMNKKDKGKLLSDVMQFDEIDTISGKRMHFSMSLLWDQCKECNINMEDPDDIELTTIEIKTK